MVKTGLGNWLRVTSLMLLAISTIVLLSASGMYHMLEPGAARSLMRQLDMTAVFVLIAGTITPIHAILFRGRRCWLPIGAAWIVALVGMTMINVYPETFSPDKAIVLFLLMGWSGAISCALLGRRYGLRFVMPMWSGGLAYTTGALVLTLQAPTLIPGVITAHEIWHMAVLVGLSLHWSFIQQIASGVPSSIACVSTAAVRHAAIGAMAPSSNSIR